MVTNVFTFGVGHGLRQYYVEITAESVEECRERMFELFGSHWCMPYSTREAAGVTKYRLTKLNMNPRGD